MISDGLGWWYRVMRLALTHRLPDLTTRQLTLFMHVALTPPPHTVRGLAEALAISKPAVTRALDRLAAAGYLERTRDASDRRSVLVTVTAEGEAFLAELDHLVQLAGVAPRTAEPPPSEHQTWAGRQGSA
ncbi:MAG: MarR family winged helix-turn-helix transcriptional regulator [Rhodospirillales bacterium]